MIASLDIDNIEWLKEMIRYSTLQDCKPRFAKIIAELERHREREKQLAEKANAATDDES